MSAYKLFDLISSQNKNAAIPEADSVTRMTYFFCILVSFVGADLKNVKIPEKVKDIISHSILHFTFVISSLPFLIPSVLPDAYHIALKNDIILTKRKYAHFLGTVAIFPRKLNLNLLLWVSFLPLQHSTSLATNKTSVIQIQLEIPRKLYTISPIKRTSYKVLPSEHNWSKTLILWNT